jgi:hypothetical protein
MSPNLIILCHSNLRAGWCSLIEGKFGLKRFGSTHALDGNRYNFNHQHYLPLEVMNKLTELQLCGIEPGKCKCNGDKLSTISGMNTS